ncbi:hypothetical protein K493DRAFT_315854 [Basidiobolus meristosporus CBS 931.73]|uniref:Uncharacterized protein n=1 Tax=Basidiobolus meristosporus CBS 931.73 TaxID=1314790 RepID=A0A1Y1Y6V7_9FUNG|nr:hypothetical protein K493DRAFT_315854 [Basidiobolus meristosporus CBS 931.73]|eukprot:ORX93751.1 hypothetical protein K493DRAFT_315854 [Basidiobolus meristosporus CBS 931.73]
MTQLLNTLLTQEAELQFEKFTNEDALQLGLLILSKARALNGKPVTIDISRNNQRLFHFAMDGTCPDNGEWIQRKTRTVLRFGHSSYYVGQYIGSQGKSIEEKYMVSEKEYAAHGGAFPLTIKNVGIVGAIAVSGLAQQDDHQLVVDSIQEYLGASQQA